MECGGHEELAPQVMYALWVAPFMPSVFSPLTLAGTPKFDYVWFVLQVAAAL